jgi:tetratricopeptide (TPR) repeat protein
MCRNWTIRSGVFTFSILLFAAMGRTEQPQGAVPPSAEPPPTTQRQKLFGGEQVVVPSRRDSVPSQGAPAVARRTAPSPEGSYPAGTDTYPNPVPDSSAWSGEPMTSVAPWAGSPLAYSASRDETTLRIEDLMRGAAALRTQGNFSKAMALYNEALKLAPKYAEGYRQRALTLVRLGNRVQAQVDYNRYLMLDPQAAGQIQEEIVLFEQSGRTHVGEADAASYSYGAASSANSRGTPPTIKLSPQQRADDRFTLAKEAFRSGDYNSALLWAANSNREMPQARTRALMAQILFAQGDFRGAAAEARAAVAMGPVMDWRTLYSFYGYATPRFSRQLSALEEFVRQNPSSADGHFLLGYQRLALGHAEAAHAQLAIASVIEPTDVAATGLLAKDGVEVVASRRPLAQTPPREGAEVARRPTLPRAAPAPQPRGDTSVSTENTQPEVTR